VVAVDTRAEKFDACKKAGADAVIDASKGNVSEALLDLTDGIGVDVATDFVASKSSLETAFGGLNRGGRLVLLGGSAKPFTLDSELLKLEREVMGSKYATRAEVRESLEIVARGEVWPIVSEVVPLEQAEALHERVEQGLVVGRAAVRVND
jgi:propanol-preferring alcohol dehydrogenase